MRGEGFSLDGYGWYSLDLFHEYRTLARSFTANAFINPLILPVIPAGTMFPEDRGEKEATLSFTDPGVIN